MRLHNKSVWATVPVVPGKESAVFTCLSLLPFYILLSLSLLLTLPPSSSCPSSPLSLSAIDYKLKNNEACVLRGRPRKLRKSSVYLELARQVC